MTLPPNVKCVELFLKSQREGRDAGRGPVAVKSALALDNQGSTEQT